MTPPLENHAGARGFSPDLRAARPDAPKQDRASGGRALTPPRAPERPHPIEAIRSMREGCLEEGLCLRLGHLMAQAELSLPGSGWPGRFALAWLSAHLLWSLPKGGEWNGIFEGVEDDRERFSRILVKAQANPTRPSSIALARRPWLIDDGLVLVEAADHLCPADPNPLPTETLPFLEVVAIRSGIELDRAAGSPIVASTDGWSLIYQVEIEKFPLSPWRRRLSRLRRPRSIFSLPDREGAPI